MPARVAKRGKRYRVVEPNGQVVRNKSGSPVDGGGHTSRNAAQRQANAINANQE